MRLQCCVCCCDSCVAFDQFFLTTLAIEESLPTRLKSRWKARTYVSKVILYGEGDASEPETAALIAKVTPLLTKCRISVLAAGMRGFVARYPYLCLPSAPVNADGTVFFFNGDDAYRDVSIK